MMHTITEVQEGDIYVNWSRGSATNKLAKLRRCGCTQQKSTFEKYTFDIEDWKLLVIALRKYITSRSVRVQRHRHSGNLKVILADLMFWPGPPGGVRYRAPYVSNVVQIAIWNWPKNMNPRGFILRGSTWSNTNQLLNLELTCSNTGALCECVQRRCHDDFHPGQVIHCDIVWHCDIGHCYIVTGLHAG